MPFPLPWRFLLFLLKIQVIYMFTSTTRSFIHQSYHYHQRIASYDTTMMIRSSQDAVVIGGGVGGLVCASLLASSSQPGMYGMNITILEKNTNIGGRMSSEYLMSSSSPSTSWHCWSLHAKCVPCVCTEELDALTQSVSLKQVLLPKKRQINV